MPKEQINVLITDDSKVSRDLLAYIISLDPAINVMGFAENGIEALKFIKKHQPDVIVTDIEMPEMNGFQLTRKIMETNPIPIIVISGVYNQAEVATGFEAIEAGALAIIEKPKGLGDSHCMDTARFVAETIKIMSDVKLQSINSSLTPPVPSKNISSKATSKPIECNDSNSDLNLDTFIKTGKFEAVGIGASIGGPKAIRTLLSQLPKDFPLPIFVVQHITSGFIEGFINWLNASTTFNVKIAEEGEQVRPGYVYVCPDKQLMGVDNNKCITLKDATPMDQSEFSISEIFRTMSKTYGDKCIGVILTGTGKDGVPELLELKKMGAYTIAQDDVTSVKFDLPQKAIQAGAISKVLPLHQIAIVLEEIVSSSET
ncbi:MAG: chemotaxis protein CheB [Chlamydiota bacterium]|nr:chemotaxis protein CheB [Chlamydiota bacterium]